jgi:hypothetical protein
MVKCSNLDFELKNAHYITSKIKNMILTFIIPRKMEFKQK